MAQALDLHLDSEVRAFVTEAMARIKPELDGAYCREHDIKFDNHEIPAGPVITLADDIMRKAVAMSFEGRIHLK